MYKIMKVYQNDNFEGVFVNLSCAEYESFTVLYDYDFLYRMKYSPLEKKYRITEKYEKEGEKSGVYKFLDENLYEFVLYNKELKEKDFNDEWLHVPTTSTNIHFKRKNIRYVKSAQNIYNKIIKCIEKYKKGC